MLEIPLTHGKFALVDDEDADLLQFKWSIHKQGYAVRTVHYKKVKMHRVILERKIGRTLLPRELTDHRDTNRLNNQRHNLRTATHSQNAQNAKKWCHGKNQYRGVNYYRGAWHVRVGYQKKMYYVGSFSTPKEGAQAYNGAASRLYGEYAKLNVLS